jgi:hypothetical protein
MCLTGQSDMVTLLSETLLLLLLLLLLYRVFTVTYMEATISLGYITM